MKSLITTAIILGVWMTGYSSVWAAEMCVPLPYALENISVGYISQPAELQKVDEQLEHHLQPCLGASESVNMKSVCSNGRLVAEQALRVVARIDAAGKSNPFLSNAKLKSYKLGVALLEKMKQLKMDRVCP